MSMRNMKNNMEIKISPLSMIKLWFPFKLKLLGLQYSKTDQGAVQADEKTPLTVLGEVSGIKLNKGAFVFTLDALVVKGDLDYIVAGEPFLEDNDIAVRPAKRIIIIEGSETIPYASSL